MTFRIPRLRATSALGRGTLAAFFSRCGGVAGLFLMHSVLGNLLGPDGYGTVSYVLSTVAVLAAVVSLGWPAALMRFLVQYVEEREWGLLRGVATRSHQITLGAAVAGAVLLYAAARLDLFPASARAGVLFVCILLPIQASILLRRRAFLGLRRMGSSILPEEVGLPLAVVAGVYITGITTADGALMVYAVAAFVLFVLGGALLWRSIPEEARKAQPRYRTRQWMVVALPLVASALSQIILGRVDVLVLGTVADMKTVGLYSAAGRLATANTFIMTVVNAMGAPLLAAAYFGRRPAEFRSVMRRTMIWSGVGALPFFAAMLAAPELILRIFGKGFTEAAPLLMVLGAGQFLNAATGLVGTALSMTGHERVFAWTTGIAALVNVLGILVAVPRFGAMGAAVVTAASVGILNATHLWIARRIATDLEERVAAGG